MLLSNFHLVEAGDQPFEDLAECKSRGCGWKFQHKDRNIRMAACYRHLADVYENQSKGEE